MAALLSEEISESSLLTLTGGTGDDTPIIPPHDLVTPSSTSTNDPYEPTDVDE